MRERKLCVSVVLVLLTMTLALARAEVCLCVCLLFVCLLCVCVLVWRLRAMHAPFAFSLLTTATPLSYPILSEVIPLENLQICLFSFCLHPKFTSFALFPFPRRLSFSHPLCCACQTYPRRAQCGRQPKAFLKCMCADKHTCKQNANICTLFPRMQ